MLLLEISTAQVPDNLLVSSECWEKGTNESDCSQHKTDEHVSMQAGAFGFAASVNVEFIAEVKLM